MSEGHGIPGQHLRMCKHCRQEAVLTEHDSQLVETIRGTAVWNAPCPHCARTIRYTTKEGSGEPTDEDHQIVMKPLRRLLSYLRLRT